MSLSRLTRVFGALALATASLIGVGNIASPEAEAVDPPNIVVIMTDDQWFDSMAYMPKTNALLAANGVSFSNFHTSNPLCCPSRSTFLTGQYSHNHGVEGNNPASQGGFENFDDSSTIATWLHDAGYHTTMIGKYLNGYGGPASANYVPPGWDNWRVGNLGSTQSLYDYTLNENGTTVSYGNAPEDFKTDVFADKAVGNIAEQSPGGPFFMSIAVTAPHGEYGEDNQSVRAAPRHEGMFANEPFPTKSSFNEANVSDKPNHIKNLPLLTQVQQDTIVQSWRDKLEGLQSVDDLVESVVNELDVQGELDDTIIMFTSDNGFFFGEHRVQSGKMKVYQEAARVPLIIRGGAFVGGVTRPQVVANIDLAPTIAALASVTPGLEPDGISLVPYAASSTYKANRAVLLEITPTNAATFNAIRTKRWTYSLLATGEEEMYNILTDSLQLKSKHLVATQQTKKAALAAALGLLDDCAGATCQVNFSG